FDSGGGATPDASFAAVRTYPGHVVSILGWGTHTLAPLSFRGATYSGVSTLYPLISGKGRKRHGNILRKATEMVEKGKLYPVVDSGTYTFETIDAAYVAITNGKARGK